MTTIATVDTSLSTFTAETLMTKAFELTHRIHEAKHPHDAGLRDQRDAIVREMTRRSDALDRSLAMVEAAERIMRGCDETLSVVAQRTDDDDINVPVTEVREILDRAMERTTTLTCSLVKDQSLSDAISERARDIVRKVVNR